MARMRKNLNKPNFVVIEVDHCPANKMNSTLIPNQKTRNVDYLQMQFQRNMEFKEEWSFSL